MTLFNSESRRKPSSSSPSGKLGARGPLSFLLPRKTQTQGQSDFEGHRIFLSVGVASPPSRDNGGQATHPYFPFSFLDRHTHTHTHMPGSRCHFTQTPKDICWKPTYHLRLMTCSAGHLLVAFFFSYFFLPRYQIFADVPARRFSPHGFGVVVMKMTTATTRSRR